MISKRERWLPVTLVAVLASAQVAYAQRVVVLEFDGDKNDKVRTQVEKALKKADVVELVSIKKYKELAAKKKLKGAAAMTPGAVAKVAPPLRLNAAVEGALGDSFFVRILDSNGQELWKKDLPLKGGAISSKHADKLAKAIATAAKTGPEGIGSAPSEAVERTENAQRPEPEEAPAPVVETEKPTVKPESTEEEKPHPVTALPEIDLSKDSSGLTPEERERRRRDEEAEAHTSADAQDQGAERDADLDLEGRRPKVRVGPKLLAVWVSGSTTWRAYCSRPGVSSCHEYDALDKSLQPKGDTVDFSPQVPYAGFALAVDFFPFARLDKAFSGLGVLGSYRRGFSLTNVRVQTPSGETPERQVISVDEGLMVMGTYRFFYSLGSGKDALVGYVGLKVGPEVQTFEVDPNAQVPLPGSHRAFVSLGVDVSVPLARVVRIEGSGSYFVSPKAGPDEIAGYGNALHESGGVDSSGFAFEAGLGGDLWGPFGYTVRFRLTSYTDQFHALPEAPGQKWPCNTTQCGGAAQETYSGLYWGITFAF